VRDSTAHEIANAFYRTVNRGIRVMFACSGADRSGGLQRHGHCADNGVTRRVTVVSSQDDADTADTARMSGQRREHTILGIRASLYVTGFVVVDHLDTHGFDRTSRDTRILSRSSYAGKDWATWGALLSA
jgi:hypothetical protein